MRRSHPAWALSRQSKKQVPDTTFGEAFAEVVRRNRHGREAHGVAGEELLVVELMAHT